MSQKRFEYISKTSWKRVNKNSLTWWYILQTSRRLLQNVSKTSWRCPEVVFEDILKMSWRRFEKVLRTPWRRLQNVLRTSWRHFEDVLKTSWRRISKVSILVLIKTSSEDVWVRWIYSSWWRRLQDDFWRRRRKKNICWVCTFWMPPYRKIRHRKNVV